MSLFDDLLDEYVGDEASLDDISVIVRRCWFYDFVDNPLRIWQGKGRLFTSDGNEWLGSIDAMGSDLHETPPIQDGRDGSSVSYKLGLTIPDLDGESPRELYEAIKADQALVAGRTVTCYLALFQIGEGLRPATPISFFKELTMFSPTFAETLEEDDGRLKRIYKISLTAKDSNYGRSSIPNGTYTDSVQKRRAEELGVSGDRGCEYVALLANRTYQIP